MAIQFESSIRVPSLGVGAESAPASFDASALTAERAIAIRDIAGTMALLSDVTAGGSALTAKVFRSAVQSIPNNAATALTFDSESFDTDVIHDNVTNNSRLTCKTASKYLLQGQLTLAAHTGGSRELRIRQNGTAQLAAVRERADDLGALGADGSEQTIVQVSVELDLAVNDYVELLAFQNSGGAVNTVAGEGATWFSMVSVLARGATGATGPVGATGTTSGVFNETPAGTIDGTNLVFTLSQEPVPVGSLLLFNDGVLMERGATLDYTVSVATITFNAGSAPVTGSRLLATFNVLMPENQDLAIAYAVAFGGM